MFIDGGTILFIATAATIAASITVILPPIPTVIATEENPLNEDTRYAAYLERNYTWPLTSVNPNTDGWKRLMFRRLAQVERITNDVDRYNGFYSTISSAITAPNFTESGWGLTRAPQELLEELQRSLHAGLPSAEEEEFDESIKAELRPLFISQNQLSQKALLTLLPIHQQWSKLPGLVPSAAYGLRVYRNQSTLLMHLDRLDTHVISGILHVGHDDESEPWPLVIEDFQGNTNEVVLEAGDLLLYESSKCFHGRPRAFSGSWYTSLFVHYRPGNDHDHADPDADADSDADADDIDLDRSLLEAHYAIPPHWSKAQPPDERLDELIIADTSFSEPNCPHGWCALEDAVRWHGPGIEGKVISTTGTTTLAVLEPQVQPEETLEKDHDNEL